MKKRDKNMNDESNEKNMNDEVEYESNHESKNIEIEKEKSGSEDENEQKESFENKIAELEKEIISLNDALLRKAAEFENYKRRNENDQSNLIKYAAENFILRILPVYDDLGRSLAHIDDENNIKSIKEGLKLVFDKFSRILDDHGVKPIESIGKPFDFNFHEALLQREEEGVAPHTVIEEIEKGYMYKDKVLRHSKVIVSQESTENAAQNNEIEQSKKSEENI